MEFIVVNSADSGTLWTEKDWPVIPRTGETVKFGNRELEVKDVDHDLQRRQVVVWVRVPLIELRDL